MNPLIKNESAVESFSLMEILRKVLFKYYYFLISIPFFFSLAYIYLKYTPAVYESSAKILLEKKKDSKASGLQDVIVGVDLFGHVVEVGNEIEKIGSFKNALKAASSLNQLTLVSVGNIKQVEVYPQNGLLIQFDTLYKIPYGKRFELTLLDSNKYKISSDFFLKDSSLILPEKNKDQMILENGREIDLSTCRFTIKYDKNLKFPSNYYFIIDTKDALAQKLLKSVKVSKFSKDASIVELKIRSQNVHKQVDILNAFCESYISLILEEKNYQAKRTVEFINLQLKNIFDSLAASEIKLEKFKQDNKLYDLESNAKLVLQEIQELQTQKLIKDSQRNYYQYLEEAISKELTNYDEIISPSLQGVQDPILSQMITELIGLNKLRKLKFTEMGKKSVSPEIRELDRKIDEIQKSVAENVRGLISVNQNELKIINSKISMLDKEVSRLPSSQRSLVNIDRQFKLNETLFNFLLQKKYEAQIALASNSADAYVLEYARASSTLLVAPKVYAIFMIAGLLAISIPLGLILILDALDDKIYILKHIEQMSTIPVIGKIPHKETEQRLQNPIHRNPKSSMAEAFRALRINLQFLASDKPVKVIGLTSTAPGEGKTFCAFNLAVIHAMGGKKTLLLGADLRKPKIASYFQNLDSTVGVSNYIAGRHSIDEIVRTTEVQNLWVIPSGDIPPNPAELLSSDKFSSLIAQLKNNFEIIIIDNAPIGLVSDFFALSKHLDITLFVVRQAYSRKGFVYEVNKLVNEGRITNVSFILNDVGKSSKYGYGEYGYGYGYGYSYGYTNDGSGYYVEQKNNNKNWFRFFKVLKK